jgi:hypothetical protein
MSAIEQLPLPSPADRRRGDRTRLHRVLNALVGRHEGVFVDISLRGAKLRHSGALQCRSTVRIAFEWERQKFAASAEVLASRIVTLGTRDGEAATYESRFRFTSMTDGCIEILSRVIAAVGNEELRTWVGNLKGFGDDSRVATPRAHGFIRCRRMGMRWEKKWTRDASQPIDGFVLPAGTDPSEIASLCRAWEGMDTDGRHLLRLTAEAVVQEFIGGTFQ